MIMKQLLLLLTFPALGLGCLIFSPQDWKRTPEIIGESKVEIRMAIEKANEVSAEIDTALAQQQALLDAQQKAITWQSSQIEYLNKKYGPRAPIR